MGGGGGGFAQLELWETLLWKKARLGLIFWLLLPPDGEGLGADATEGGGIPEINGTFFLNFRKRIGKDPDPVGLDSSSFPRYSQKVLSFFNWEYFGYVDTEDSLFI